MKLKILFLGIISVSGLLSGIDYAVQEIPLSAWLSLSHVQTVERGVLQCAKSCNDMFEKDQSCNAVIFDESNDVCTRALYAPKPAEPTGLRTAWASIVNGNSWKECNAIDGNPETIFSTKFGRQDFPWLAIDLIWTEEVTKVEMTNWDRNEALTKDIEVRVGFEKPFEKIGAIRDTLYTSNNVCGVFHGPGEKNSIASIPCTTPLLGRYVTLQKVVKEERSGFNWVEVKIETSPYSCEKIEILLRSDPIHTTPDQCPKDYPYAFYYGHFCCDVVDQVSPSSTYCSGDCDQRTRCSAPPCSNYQYQAGIPHDIPTHPQYDTLSS